MNLEKAQRFVNGMKSICPEAKDEIKQLLEILVNGELEPPKREFEVGDFVRVDKDYHLCDLRGWCGQVKRIRENTIGVEFPDKIPESGGHTLDGSARMGHGRWIYPHCLELID